MFHNKPYSTAKRKKKQWNRTDKANSSYSRPKKRKNKNESSYEYYSKYFMYLLYTVNHKNVTFYFSL